MKIPCSSCNQRLEIPEELAGQTIDCPACNATLAVPALETPPPAVPQVQESAPQAASSKKSKSSIPKWAIASVAGIAVVVVGLIMFFPDKAVKTDEESQQSAPLPKEKPYEPVADAAKPELLTANAQTGVVTIRLGPDISIWGAASNGNIVAVKQHLAAGTDVNAKDGFADWTALHWAVQFGHKEIAELLIAKGAKLNVQNSLGYTPLDLAAMNENKEIADLLRKHSGISGAADSIHVAAAVGNIETVKQHLADGTDVNAKLKVGFKGTTPLDVAIKRKRTEIATLLRKHGGKTGEELKAEGK